MLEVLQNTRKVNNTKNMNIIQKNISFKHFLHDLITNISNANNYAVLPVSIHCICSFLHLKS